MKKKEIDKTDASYSQSVKISDYSELLFISVQIPLNKKGELPTPNTFEKQCQLAWANVERQLQNADMDQYLLDTDICIAFLKGKNDLLKKEGV